ncbi:hypothetical protein C3404_23825 [Citrobacter freundii complex sp. CFNIH11]|nr:hypothetical protein C3404_23825 [Citrobacter freundii complex sp. CFNIH11]
MRYPRSQQSLSNQYGATPQAPVSNHGGMVLVTLNKLMEKRSPEKPKHLKLVKMNCDKSPILERIYT